MSAATEPVSPPPTSTALWLVWDFDDLAGAFTGRADAEERQAELVDRAEHDFGPDVPWRHAIRVEQARLVTDSSPQFLAMYVPAYRNCKRA